MMEQAGTVLVVDDDPEILALVKDILEERGHRVALAESGIQALARMGEEDFSVVLTDLRMKGMQLLIEIKRTHPERNILLMTEFGFIDTAIQAMKEGATDYLMKPVKTDELVRVVERALLGPPLHTGYHPGYAPYAPRKGEGD